MGGLSKSVVIGAMAALGVFGGAISAGTSLRNGEVGVLRGVGIRPSSLFDALSPLSVSGFGYRTGPGFTAAHIKRMSKKRRNQQRHKKACRKARK